MYTNLPSILASFTSHFFIFSYLLFFSSFSFILISLLLLLPLYHCIYPNSLRGWQTLNLWFSFLHFLSSDFKRMLLHEILGIKPRIPHHTANHASYASILLVNFIFGLSLNSDGEFLYKGSSSKCDAHYVLCTISLLGLTFKLSEESVSESLSHFNSDPWLIDLFCNLLFPVWLQGARYSCGYILMVFSV